MKVLPMEGMLSLQVNSEYGLRTYNRGRGGQMNMPEKDARTAIREGAVTLANVAGPTAHIKGGFTCVRCGRRNWFRRCGKCEEES